LNSTESLIYIIPELLLFTFSLLVLALGALYKNRNILGVVSLSAVGLAALFLFKSHSAPGPLFFNLLSRDSFSQYFCGLTLLCAFVVILISMGYRLLSERYPAEYYFLILNAAAAIMLLVSSNNLLMVYVSLEMLSLTSCILISFLRGDIFASESALKYFIFGAFSSAIMLFGISYAYGIFGTTDLSQISRLLSVGSLNNYAVFTALVFILAGFAFKCSLVPFHMWAPDVYQGAPTPITAFISVAPKIAGFALLLRVFLNSFASLTLHWSGLFTLISILTMTAGNLIAVSQTNIKRMLAYSSIAHAGYILIGLAVGTPLGIRAAVFYIFSYLYMNLGAFACIVLISNSIKSDNIEDYAGCYKREPFSAFFLAMFLLSLAGIPPLAGFLAKFLVFAAAIQAKFVLLAVIAAINSAIALYYYAKVIKYIYLSEPQIKEAVPTPLPLQLALLITLSGIFIIGLYPHPFLRWITALHF